MFPIARSRVAVAAACLLVAGPVAATNGMNLEGYGVIGGAMGGTGLAYDNGTAALMNNPATLAMMAEGARLDAALGFLGPDVHADNPAGPAPGADSGATLFGMPAFGYATRSGRLTLAGGVFAQGGMGTEYGANTDFAMGSGDKVRSEVGVGRAMLAAAYRVNERLNLGGSLDLVWAGMDLKMAVPISYLDPTSPSYIITNNTFGMDFSDLATDGIDPNTDWARFDFSNGSPISGKARGYGYGYKLGLTYKLNDMATLGMTYHSKTRLADLKTGSAFLSTDESGGRIGGTVYVRDFQWPETYGVGLSLQPSERLQLALDIKRIRWSDAMASFDMTFTNPGGTVDVSMPQGWRDQTVYALGAAYEYNKQLTVRAGFNYGKNPVPDTTVNPLFPAIVERHFTLGASYAIDSVSDLHMAASFVPRVTVVNSQDGTVISHSQFSWGLMYTRRFD